MPQFEIEDVRTGTVTRIRARDEGDAVLSAGVCGSSHVEIDSRADLAGWRKVRSEGKAVARIRPHNRMKFRRD